MESEFFNLQGRRPEPDILDAERVAEGPAVDGTHAALGLHRDGGSEVTLHPSTFPPTHWRQLARLLHHHPQRLALALRREKPQLPAAHVIHVRQRSHERSEI